ncbi:ferrochelatase, partial [Acinetobacter baumannii]
SVQVLCPAFSADCLETLEEIAVENRDIFLKAGGQRYEYVPALNADPAHLDFLAGLLASRITALR